MKLNSINQKLIKNLIISGPALISNFDKLIFIHLPRSGGKCIKTAFFSKYISSLIFNFEHRFINKIYKNDFPSSHSSLQEISDKIQFKKIINFDKFTIIRDPFSRLISIYKHLIYFYLSKLSQSQLENSIADLATPANFIENIKKKSLKHDLPSSQNYLFAFKEKNFYFPDHIFSLHKMSSCHDYLKNKYKLTNFVNTSSSEINNYLPNWREPSSITGNYPLIDNYIINKLAEFEDYKSEINDLWFEEISIINTHNLDSNGEVKMDKNRFMEFLRRKNSEELKELAYQNDYLFYSRDLISKNG